MIKKRIDQPTKRPPRKPAKQTTIDVDLLYSAITDLAEKIDDLEFSIDMLVADVQNLQ